MVSLSSSGLASLVQDDSGTQKQNTGKFGSPVSESLDRFYTGNFWFGVVVGLLNSECAQQNCADEYKYGTYRQCIQPQGKVHGRCLPC